MKRRVTKRETHAKIDRRRASWHQLAARIMATHAQQLANRAGLRAPARSRRTAKSVRAPVRAQAFPQGGSNGDGGSNSSHSWAPHRKQLVEALTAGSGLARAPSVWYVDKDDDTLRMPASLLADAPSAASTSAPEGSTRNDGLPVVRVNARQVGVSHRAIAHGDSADASSLRGELERHIKGGGATVLVMPIVDPLIMDVGGPGAMRETMDEGDEVIFGANHGGNSLSGSSSGAGVARSLDFDETFPVAGSFMGTRRVLVEGTVCKCDPNDPGDCCARGLSTYCVSCPVLQDASNSGTCDEGCDGLGVSLVNGAMASMDGGCEGLEGGNVGGMRCGGHGVGDCAFARAIRTAAETHVHRHQYYAAIVQTSHRASAEFGRFTTSDEDEFVDPVSGVGYEEFLVFRPNGDAWLGGLAPPPTSVRRANFGPKLRSELKKLEVQQTFNI